MKRLVLLSLLTALPAFASPGAVPGPVGKSAPALVSGTPTPKGPPRVQPSNPGDGGGSGGGKCSCSLCPASMTREDGTESLLANCDTSTNAQTHLTTITCNYLMGEQISATCVQ